MIRRIVLDNFMAHGRTEIELSPGLTVLVGPNNCGKSAVVEALLTICRNLPGEVVVRHGEKICRVTLETDEEHVIVWQRKGSTVSYEVDGKPFHRLGRDVPEEAQRVLRLAEVETALDKFEVHFGVQKSPLFLLGYSDQKIASFFSSSSDAEKLMAMQRKHKEKVRNAKQRHKEWTEEIEGLDKLLAALAPLDGIGLGVEKLEKEFAAIRAADQDYAHTGGLIDDLDAAGFKSRWMAGRLGRMGEMKPPPELDDVPALERLIESAEKERIVIQREGRKFKAAEKLAGPPEMVQTAMLEHVIASMAEIQRQKACAERKVRAAQGLRGPVELEDEKALVETGKALRRGIEARRLALAWREALDKLEVLPTLDDARPLEELLKQCEENRKSAARVAVDVVELDDAILKVEAEVRGWAEKNPTCPVCGGEVRAEAMLAGGHGHE
jgi:energy-coupling factor transporter ATP-binding protein EcfA2